MNLSKLQTLWRNRARLRPVLRATRPVFSQFGEDLAIAQLLHPQRHGTYVDVGANRPFDGSNTAYLYTLGWSGLAIDPNPMFAAEFKKHRPRDIHLTMGVAAIDTVLTYYEFPEDWLNTFSASRADELSQLGNPPRRKVQIPCRPLRQLIADHLPGRHIDVLAVDCEGMDLDVLKSADLAQLRPTVLVVEDFTRYLEFRDGMPGGVFDQYLRSMAYSPIYQSAWSSIYVADDWRDMPGSDAFRPPQSLQEYMPKPKATR